MMTEKTAALLLAGSFFFAFGRVKQDVTIGGVQVGGMTYAEAENAIRSQFCGDLPPVTVHTPSGDVRFREGFTVKDDIARLVRRAKRGETLSVSYRREWADAEDALFSLCARNAREAKDAEMTFSAEGFRYTHEVLGVSCDYQKLLADVQRVLHDGGEVTLATHRYAPAVTEELLRARTRELSSFRTYFDGSNAPRRHNIALAASRIAGTVLAPQEVFSFNAVVGKRTTENGFRSAAVILDGEFVPGVGGGVCQTSTTLFGAALRAGMEIVESRPHSLSVGYVPPSEDVMVSEASDLKFRNPYPYPVYILAEMGQGSVRFRLFGMPDGRRYEVESRVLGRVPPPPPEEVEGEEDAVLRNGKEGIVSESYLVVYGRDGALFSRTRIRRDSYAPVRGKISVKREEELPAEAQDGPDAPQNGGEMQKNSENGRKIG